MPSVLYILDYQARREGGVGGKLPRAPRRLGGPAVAHKYKVHQNAPFSKEKFQNFLSGRAPQKCLGGGRKNVFPGPALAFDGPVDYYLSLVLIFAVQLIYYAAVFTPLDAKKIQILMLPNHVYLANALIDTVGSIVSFSIRVFEAISVHFNLFYYHYLFRFV